MALLRRSEGQGYETVSVPLTALYNMYEVDGRVYHVVPEAVHNDGRTIQLCGRCRRTWSPDRVADRVRAAGSLGAHDAHDAHDGGERTADDFEDLYDQRAPQFSIAAGADFGRLSALASMGIAVDVSVLVERLVLADARPHMVVYKVVAYEQETERKRLHGHSLV
jgi:hypothetical protein